MSPLPHRRFLLVSHIDTVDFETKSWIFPPLGAVIDDGRMYGRGTCDNKAGVAVSIYTLQRLR